MENVNNIYPPKSNQDPPPRRTPLSNSIAQFLLNSTSTVGNFSTVNMNKNDAGCADGSTTKETNCKARVTTINDDIEMVEEDSAEENDVPDINNHTESVSSAAAIQKENDENIVDTGADDNNDDTVSSNNNSDAEDAPFDTSQKLQKLKRTQIDEDICMIEADYDGDNIDADNFDTPEPYDITETPDELQLSDLNASQNNKTSSTINNEANTGYSDSPNTNKGRKRNVSVSTPNADTRKVNPEDYEYGVTVTNKANGRLIVFEENDRTHVREYTHSHGKAWYCRFCFSTSRKKKMYGFMNNDKNFDALINHECKPITYEESKLDQEKIKEKFAVVNGNRKRNSRASSVFHLTFENDDEEDDADYEVAAVTSPTHSRTFRSRRTRTIDTLNSRGNTFNGSEKESNQSEFTESFGPNSSSRRSNIVSSTPVSAAMLEVPSSDWKYGYDTYGKYEKRIIVSNILNNQRYAYEYGVYGNSNMRCLGCYRAEHAYRSAKFDKDMKLFVPTNHICTPKLYAEIEEEQKSFERKTNKSERNESDNFGSSRSKRSRNDVDESRQESDTSLNSPRQNDVTNRVGSFNDVLYPSPAIAPRVQSFAPATSHVRTSSSPNIVQRNSQANISPSSVQFHHPGGYFLSESCKKLEINYSPRYACDFWNKITVDLIEPNSSPQNIRQMSNQKMSGFATLSSLFTGSEDFALEIKSNLNTYFLKNVLDIGQLIGEDLSQSFNPKIIETSSANDLLEIHFVALARWLECRFVVYDNGNWKKYGDWNSSIYVPIVLMEKKAGKYSPILSLKD